MCIYSCLGISPFAGVTYTQHRRSMQTIYKLQVPVTKREFRPQKRRAKGMYVTAIAVCTQQHAAYVQSIHQGLIEPPCGCTCSNSHNIMHFMCGQPWLDNICTILLLYKQWSYNAITCIHTPIQKYFGDGLQYVTIIKLLNHEGWLASNDTNKQVKWGWGTSHPSTP